MTDLNSYDITRQSPDLEAIPHEADPPERPPLQDRDSQDSPDPNLPAPAFPLPEELDPASPARQSTAQSD